MHKGNYAGLQNGLARGTHKGLRKGLLRGTVANNQGTPEKFCVVYGGDSNGNGTALQLQQVPTNTLFYLNGGSFQEVTTQSISNDTPIYGSIAQHMAIEYKAAFGKPVYAINVSKGGTYYSNSVASMSWGSSGDLRSLALTKIARGLSILGKGKPDLIVWNCGVNDVRNSFAVGTITTAIDDFYNFITSAYPGVPVLIIQIGRREVSGSDPVINGPLFYAARKAHLDAAITYTNAHVVALTASNAFITGDYDPDLLHYGLPLQRKIGKQIVQWLINSRFSKWGRSTLSWRYGIPSNKQKILWDNFITSQVTNINLFRFEGLHIYKTGVIRDDCLVDYSGIGYLAFGGSPTFTEGSHLTFNGSTDYIATGILPDIYDGRGSDVNNVTVGCRVKANRSAGTTALFGSSDAAGSISIVQNGVRYRVNDGTLSAGTDTVFQANTTYTVRRENGTTKRLLKDKTSNASAVVANTGQVDTYSQVVAAIQSSGGITSHTDCDLEYYFYAGYTNFDYDSFYDAMDTLITNW